MASIFGNSSFGSSIFGQNPVSDWVAPRRNALMGLSAGFLSGDPGAAMIGAMQGMGIDRQYAMDAQEKAKEQQSKNATLEWLRSSGYNDLVSAVESGGLDVSTAWGEALKRQQPGYGQENLTANQRDFMFAQENPGFGDFLGQGSGSTEFGLQPIWFQRPDGTYGYGVQGKDGTFKEVDTGGNTMLDPRSLNFERGFGSASGKASGEATAAAPGDIAAGQAALDLIGQIRSSPELGWATGTSAGLGGNAIPGTGRYGFQNLVDQAKSGAFLTAVQEMRGLGALSNTEGQAATQAITRINTALSTEDFLKALADYEAIVMRGMQRAQARLQGGGQQPVSGAGAGGYTVLGVE